MLARCGWWDGIVLANRGEVEQISKLSGEEREEAILQVAISIGDLQLEIPENVWIGYSVASNKDVFQSKPYQSFAGLNCNKFLSVEPLVSEVNLHLKEINYWSFLTPIKWVIVGGESGPNAREMDIAWAKSIRSQCQQSGVAFFMKQLSQANTQKYKHFETFPKDLQVRELPNFGTTR